MSEILAVLTESLEQRRGVALVTVIRAGVTGLPAAGDTPWCGWTRTR